MTEKLYFIDTEVSEKDHRIHDFGAVASDGGKLHCDTWEDFRLFISDGQYLCGHNIVHHDAVYLKKHKKDISQYKLIDTLYLSALLFPRRPYHALLKDDKLQTDELNNPVNDALKCQKLFADEVSAYLELPKRLKQIYYCLLHEQKEFSGFFDYMGVKSFYWNVSKLIPQEFDGMICANADLSSMIRNYPVELAYALALIHTGDEYSMIPRWLTLTYPQIAYVMHQLRSVPCKDLCPYCQSVLDIHKGLKKYFGYDSFRTYNGEPLQESAAQAAVDGKSLLAVFPTGGGKSITFQLPALMAGNTVHGLTVVISPLQSLMKDQVDHLSEAGVTGAVTINGLLSPIERSEALERVETGLASILYISPEQLRSRTIERILSSRTIVRFVIDEAHCFSAWGQDFRVDYLYIGDFIAKLQKMQKLKKPIPVSCFTATAKQKVISDICDYFKRKLDLNLELFATSAARENLHYAVLFCETEDEKYQTLRNLIQSRNVPSIVYVSRTKKTEELAEKLTADGYPALPYHGRMESKDKVANQEAFLDDRVRIIVATSAFGMGVDKSDVGLVVHYEISDSLENYVQEAGRAGRNPSLEAECCVLFNNNDLDKHFLLLNQTKLTQAEIQAVWKAVRNLCGRRNTISCSALEIAREAGWEDSGSEAETRVRTAIAALEQAGYVKRGMNVPHVYATGILAKNMAEASERIEKADIFNEEEKLNARRIIKSLISSRSIASAGNDEAESRVDYLADILGIEKGVIIEQIGRMRQIGLLADSQDMSAYVKKGNQKNHSLHILERYAKIEDFVIRKLGEGAGSINYREWNDQAIDEGLSYSTVRAIRSVLYFLTIRSLVQKEENAETKSAQIQPAIDLRLLRVKYEHRIEVCRYIVEELYRRADKSISADKDVCVEFSLLELLNGYSSHMRLDIDDYAVTLSDISDALLYLSKIGAMRLEGGFLVSYNAMQIERTVLDNKVKYKQSDYRMLDDFYKQKIQQIHIVGEYANLMVKDYQAALAFVQDYFEMDYQDFITAYFKGSKAKKLNRNITEQKYEELFGSLSDIQEKVINDHRSRRIVVAAGPGSGKTRLLVHKLASLLLLEDIKHDQLLMLTFSRAAATEFKSRLIKLVGSAAYFVDVKTFHSYCFDLLGQMGTIEKSNDVISKAVEMIESGEVEPSRIMKHVLVIDEAQDMDEEEYRLVQALMKVNDDMRVIAVGDDDQNIYAFRGSDAKYFQSLITDYHAIKYEMNENYRSTGEIVALSNALIASASNRMKTVPCEAVSPEAGTAEIIRHTSRYIEEAVARHLVSNQEKGRIAVLTQTNEEAMIVNGLLHKFGIRSRLLQSNTGFRFSNLAEVRYFLKKIDEERKEEAVISDDAYTNAVDALKKRYAGSALLPLVVRMTRQFRYINQVKYASDLTEFIEESSVDDFVETKEQYVFVSTMHKAKGREFDSVYPCINQMDLNNDESRRLLYVAMTRARRALYIHTRTNLFWNIHIPGVLQRVDTSVYSAPAEVYLELSMKQVDLGYVKGKKNVLLRMISGQKLKYSEQYLYAEIMGKDSNIVRFSKAMRSYLKELMDKGYSLTEAEVQYVLAWQGEGDEEESAVVLPKITLKKS